jgi:NAD(P)-dependent dehydrogenase (short-subunit alcohol dehydrogenase family)
VPKSRKPVALVTGAANGIGCVIAHHLLTIGWSVGVLDLSNAELRHSFGRVRGAALIEGDVADEKTAPAAIAALVDHFGRLDAVVSNAGCLIRKPIGKLTQRMVSRYRHQSDGNSSARQRCGEGIATVEGYDCDDRFDAGTHVEPNTEAYAASKGGLVALTHALVMSLGPDIRVNCVSPGWIATQDYENFATKIMLNILAAASARRRTSRKSWAFWLTVRNQAS